MSVECVNYLKGGIQSNSDGAVTASKEEVGRWCRMIEGDLIRLEGLLYRCARSGSGVDGNWDQIISTFLRGRLSLFAKEVMFYRVQSHTFLTVLPTTTTLPSPAQAIVRPSPPSGTVAVHVLLFTSQNLQVPSLLTEASSASLVGFHATFSTAPV